MKALTKSATGMTDEQCEAGKMPEERGGRELTIAQVAKLVSTAWSRVGELTKEVPVNLGCYRAREPTEIAAPRQVGARNDKRGPRLIMISHAAMKIRRRDLQMGVSSLVLGLTNGTTISTRGAFSSGRVPVGRGQ